MLRYRHAPLPFVSLSLVLLTHSIRLAVAGGQMAQGAGAAVGLAEAVNAVRTSDQPKIEWIDVGGGLPVSWGRDVPQSPTFEEYASALTEAAPALFDGTYRVITEFGAILICKHAFFASVVEVCMPNLVLLLVRTISIINLSACSRLLPCG